MPTKPRFWLTQEACLKDNPELGPKQIIKTPYSGPVTPEFIVTDEQPTPTPQQVLETLAAPFQPVAEVSSEIAEESAAQAPEAPEVAAPVLTPAQKAAVRVRRTPTKRL